MDHFPPGAQTRLDRFVAFSQDVTAFEPIELRGTGLADSYLKTVDAVVGVATTDALLDRHRALDRSEATVLNHGLRRDIFGCERLGPVARSIIKMWYIGTWYALPADWQDRYGPALRDGTFVVSSAAYVEGLLWPAIGAHPPGAKAPGFATWTRAPVIPPFKGDPASLSGARSEPTQV